MQLLKNFFVKCSCGQDLRFDTIDQIRTCPDCGMVRQIGPATKSYLIDRYGSDNFNTPAIEIPQEKYRLG
jgi:predicted RNA-binding Zn-ribbon protein involved in translation (DUF1610 family)